MKPIARAVAAAACLCAIAAFASDQAPTVDWDMAAKIREEGLQRSQVMDIVGYMTDVLGGRLTLSENMKRAQLWAKGKMEALGLENVAIEPFMDYGAAWDNEYFSLHMLAPEYQPMTGFPLAYTSGTKGKVVAPAVIAADIQVKKDLDRYRGKLKGAVVLSTPPYTLDMAALTQGVSRLTTEDLARLEETVVPRPQRAPVVPPPPNPDLIKPEDKIEFFRAEGAVAVLQCTGGQMGSVVGFSRPGANEDHWSREKTLRTPPIIAVTPEHYNRMFRILRRGIPVRVEVEVRNRVGDKVEKAANVLGEIPGTDLADQVVMLGAHYDSWHEAAGASDTASGCAVALEAVRILKAIGVKPRRTIRVAFWGGEEQGLHGSREYVHARFGNPNDPKIGAKPGYEKLSVYFNQDYGAGQFRGIYLQGNERVRRLFAAWMEPFRDFGLTALSIQSVGSTDHVSFDQAGLPGFQFIQDRIGGTAGHTNLDFYDTLRAEDLMKNAAVEAFFAYQAAMSDQPIPRKPLNNK
ncbi:MAG TPA: M20/M25/M40 family metallo-hydrolase [Candidatus Aminicenantes bacterium]|nr:M20/M25/M40 family metallo-hydrolase [Candidatus Aminicenantes bacterium]HRY64023.1 M20/M25/M40 family metallo-hydrolase [Candidatus Aminicenantes bacterium]HRZ70936.1 M20/M25/M40 family metallo-hydrolase [Candidatus Aminicenantes bacterium]